MGRSWRTSPSDPPPPPGSRTRRLCSPTADGTPPAHIGNRLGQSVVLEHSRHVEVFNHHHWLGFRQPAGELMQRVGALVSHLPILPAEALCRLLPVLTALGLAGDRPVRSLEL